MLGYCQLAPKEQTLVKFQSKYKIFIHENATENIVCDMAAILSSRGWVKSKNHMDIARFKNDDETTAN